MWNFVGVEEHEFIFLVSFFLDRWNLDLFNCYVDVIYDHWKRPGCNCVNKSMEEDRSGRLPLGSCSIDRPIQLAKLEVKFRSDTRRSVVVNWPRGTDPARTPSRSAFLEGSGANAPLPAEISQQSCKCRPSVTPPARRIIDASPPEKLLTSNRQVTVL